MVLCTFEIEIEIPDTMSEEDVLFDIEENHCPGTGIVGAAFDKIYEEFNRKNLCWGCALKGKNEIISDP